MQTCEEFEAIIAHLQALLETGTRWEAKGRDPRTGCDCYGLIAYAYQLQSILLPTTAEEAEVFFRCCEPPYKAWDVILCRIHPLYPRHLLLCMGTDWGFHSAAQTNGLARWSLQQPFWRRMQCQGWRYRLDDTGKSLEAYVLDRDCSL